MKPSFLKIIAPGLAIVLPGAVGMPVAAAEVSTNSVPPPADIRVDFDRDIRPLLEASCLRCHGPQKPRSHFRLDDRAAALAGGDENTNDIVPGDSARSRLIAYVARTVPDMEMPPNGRGNALTPAQIGWLCAWIDQGAVWSATNEPPQLNLVVAPTLRWFGVSGNQAKFSELQETPAGFSGGVEKFSASEQINPNETVSLEGCVLAPNQDYDLKLSMERTDLGFVHVGFDQWRQYYATDGGYNPTVTPSQFDQLNSNLHVDNGRAWADFGLDLPHWPLIVLGYEYQYRNGTESTLDWGTANGKNIYPATQSVDEQTHILKLDVSKSFDGWDLANSARVELYREANQDNEAAILLGGATPDEFINTRDSYHQVNGMDTFTLEKQIRDWWLLDGGFYYSRLYGSDLFNQTTAIPAFSFINPLGSQQITLNRESEIFSVANLFTPRDDLSLSLGTQNEWTRENGFGVSIPDLDLGANVPADSDLDEFKASQTANIRFTGLSSSVVFGDAEFSEDNYSIAQNEDTTALDRETAANNLRYDLKSGFSLSPWRWWDWTVQGTRQYSDTEYNQLTDVFLGLPGPTNGYPAFILERNITTDQFETKLALHPVTWLKTTLTYQLTDTDYSSRTDPAFDASLPGAVSDGGFILDGQYHLQTYGLSATFTPIRRLYFSSAFTYSRSEAVTADNGDPSIVPYEGNIYTLNAAATYALNVKTSLQVAYTFSRADYAENNATAGIPAGLDYTRHDVIVGLNRQLTKHWSGALRYEFSQYTEPSSGNANNFTAQGVFATLIFKWP